MSELTLKNFSSGYKSHEKAVYGVSMNLSAGSVTAVIGPNGSGKSTLLKGIMSFPGMKSEGLVTLNSLAIPSMNRRERAARIAYLPQSPPLPAGLTAIETVLLGRFPHRNAWSSDSPGDIEIAMDALEMVGAEHLAEKHTDEISGGENRLVNLAAVLSQQTEIILLDEPGSSLDYGHAAQLWELLSRLASRGIIILATTHRIEMSGNAFDKVLLLSGGKSVAFGKPEEVFLSGDLLSSVYNTPMSVRRASHDGSWIVFPGDSK